jgi:hypothetical protein
VGKNGYPELMTKFGFLGSQAFPFLFMERLLLGYFFCRGLVEK